MDGQCCTSSQYPKWAQDRRQIPPQIWPRKKSNKEDDITKNLKPQEHFKLGNMELEETATKKYLGMTIHSKDNLDDHLSKVKGKVETAYQTILKMARTNHSTT